MVNRLINYDEYLQLLILSDSTLTCMCVYVCVCLRVCADFGSLIAQRLDLLTHHATRTPTYVYVCIGNILSLSRFLHSRVSFALVQRAFKYLEVSLRL